MSHERPSALNQISKAMLEEVVAEIYTYDLDDGPPKIGGGECVACETYVYSADLGQRIIQRRKRH
jgi:hypothetical protein